MNEGTQMLINATTCRQCVDTVDNRGQNVDTMWTKRGQNVDKSWTKRGRPQNVNAASNKHKI